MVDEQPSVFKDEPPEQRKKSEPLWLIWIAVLLAGIILLADAFGATVLQKLTARLGIALVYSAFALVVGNGRKSGYVAAALICVAVVVTLFV